MEAIIAVSIIGLGYLFQNNTEYTKKKKLSATKSQRPNGPNIYTSNRAYEIFQNEQKQANVLMDKSLYPTETNADNHSCKYIFQRYKGDVRHRDIVSVYLTTTTLLFERK